MSSIQLSIHLEKTLKEIKKNLLHSHWYIFSGLFRSPPFISSVISLFLFTLFEGWALIFIEDVSLATFTCFFILKRKMQRITFTKYHGKKLLKSWKIPLQSHSNSILPHQLSLCHRKRVIPQPLPKRRRRSMLWLSFVHILQHNIYQEYESKLLLQTPYIHICNVRDIL